MREQIDTGAPIPEEVERITNAILKGMGDADLTSALTVLTGITGQVVAEMVEGNLAEVRRHSINVGENVKQAAYVHCVAMEERKKNAPSTPDVPTGDGVDAS